MGMGRIFAPLQTAPMKSFLLFACLSLTSLSCSAQDYHFSQFFASPLTMNPALTGLFQGRYRVAMSHRSQWAQVLETPYSTSAFAADFHYDINPAKRRYRDAFGVGVLFASDRVAELNFSTNQISLGGAFHKSLDPKNNQFLSLGVQFGVVQRNVSYDQLSFEDEFNGTDTYLDGSSGEELPENNFAFGDYHIGLNYSNSPRNGTAVFAGAAMHHINEPQQSFYFEATQGEEVEVSNTLYRRYSGYLNFRIPLGPEVQFSPRIYAYAQGPHLAANLGANFRFLLDDSKGAALHLGGWARPVRSAEEFNLDSAVAMAGIEISNFLFGFSYDIGLNGLMTDRRHQGAFEISIAYLGQSDDDEAVPCPKF